MLDENITEDYSNISPWTPSIKYGVIWGLLGIVIILGQYLSGTLESSLAQEFTTLGLVFTILGFAVAIFAVVKAILEYKSARGNRISLGQSVSIGWRTGLIYGLISAVWTYVFYTFIFTGYEDLMRDIVMSTLEDQGHDDDTLETIADSATMFSSPPVVAAFVIPVGIIMSAIISLIAGAFIKNE